MLKNKTKTNTHLITINTFEIMLRIKSIFVKVSLLKKVITRFLFVEIKLIQLQKCNKYLI